MFEQKVFADAQHDVVAGRQLQRSDTLRGERADLTAISRNTQSIEQAVATTGVGRTTRAGGAAQRFDLDSASLDRNHPPPLVDH